jgi:C1A family cysteine protease
MPSARQSVRQDEAEAQPNFVPSRLFIYYNERVIEDGQVGQRCPDRDGIKSVAHDGDCPEKEWPYDIASR